MVSKQTFRLVQIILLKLILASKTVLLQQVIDLTLLAVLSFAFVRMHPSGAFRSLHCLIYKVLTAASSVAEHLLS